MGTPYDERASLGPFYPFVWLQKDFATPHGRGRCHTTNAEAQAPLPFPAACLVVLEGGSGKDVRGVRDALCRCR